VYSEIGIFDDNPYIDKIYNRIDRDTYFLLIADIISSRSHDAQTQHGAVLVRDDRIISTGYNGFPPGAPDDIIPNTRPHKYNFINHAEANAVYAAAKLGISLEGSKLYVTGPPCHNCTKILVTLGITNWIIGDRQHACSDIEKQMSDFWINHYNVSITEKNLYECWQRFYSLRKL